MQQVKWFFIFFVVIVAQSSFVQLIAIHDVRPDLLIVALVFYSFRFGQMKSTIAGFAIGLVQDVLSGGILGLSSFTKSIAGFLCGFASKKGKNIPPGSYVLTLILVTLVHNLLFFFLYTLDADVASLNLMLYSILPASVYTIVIGVLLYYILVVFL